MSGHIFMFTSTFWLCEIAPILAICFNVLNGGGKNCRPCGTLRIVFRNVSAPDLQDKLNDLRIQERNEILILPVLSSVLKLLQESLCVVSNSKKSCQKMFQIGMKSFSHRISCRGWWEVACEMEVGRRWNGNHERNGSEYRPHQASDVHFPHNSIEIAWIK